MKLRPPRSKLQKTLDLHPLEPVIAPLEDWDAHEKLVVAEIERSERVTAEDLAVTMTPERTYEPPFPRRVIPEALPDVNVAFQSTIGDWLGPDDLYGK